MLEEPQKEVRMSAAANDRVTEEALSLPVDARLVLIEKLLTSLNLPTSEEIDRAWSEEAEHRLDQIESGEAKLLPGEEVFSRLRAKYRT
jgi:putative addiction module component (TIGR02574 family)